MGSGAFYRAAASMGSGMFCVGCNLREENPAPAARKRVQAQPAASRQYGGRGGFYGKSVRPIMSGGFYGKRYVLYGL